jgi:hypothetical protein
LGLAATAARVGGSATGLAATTAAAATASFTATTTTASAAVGALCACFGFFKKFGGP